MCLFPLWQVSQVTMMFSLPQPDALRTAANIFSYLVTHQSAASISFIAKYPILNNQSLPIGS
jgi:hypothetical protein